MKPVRLAIVVGLCMALVWSMLPVERALGQGGISGQIGLIRGALTSLGFPEPRVREGAYGFPQTAEMTSTLPVDFKPGAVQTFVRVGIRMPGDAAGVFENNSKCYLSERGPSSGCGFYLPSDQSYNFSQKGEALTVGPGLPAVLATGRAGQYTLVRSSGMPYPTGLALGEFACGLLYIEISQRRVSAMPVRDFKSQEEWVQWTQAATVDAKADLQTRMGALAGALQTGGACGSPSPQQIDLSIDHIEVVQVVQDENNSVPLVANKNTLLRLFVKVSGSPKGPVAGVSAEVLASPAGVAGPVSLRPANAPFTAPLAPDRNNLADSLNFFFPTGLALGTYPLEIHLNPTRAVSETNYDNNSLTRQLTFVIQRTFSIGYLRVGYDPTGQKRYTWPSGPIETYAALITNTFPIADNGVRYYQEVGRAHRDKPLATITDTLDLMVNLGKYYDLMQGKKPDQLVVWLPDLTPLDILGLADPLQAFGIQPHVVFVQDYRRGNAALPSIVLAHEIGHNLGLGHPGTKSPPCDAGEQPVGNYWPYGPDGPGGQRTTIHGVGFDWTTRTIVSDAHYDFMTYCGDEPQGVWISPFHFKQLFAADSRGPGETQEELLLSGLAMRDGSAGVLDPAYRLSGTTSMLPAPPSRALAFLAPNGFAGGAPAALAAETGNHCVRFSSGAATLAEHCFNLTFTEHQSGAPIPSQPFHMVVPYAAGTTRVTLLRGTKELASLTAGAGTPSVQITTVKAGQTWQGTQTLGWSASGAGAKPLTYAVLYSPDGGSSWRPLDFDFQQPQLEVDTAGLPGSDNAWLRVLATDGLSTGKADVGPIKVPQQPGAPAPQQPASGGTSPSFSPAALLPLALGGALCVLLGLGIAGGLVIAGGRRATGASRAVPAVLPRPTDLPERESAAPSRPPEKPTDFPR